ncbi:MAG: serine protease, partial [Nanoarchaeota archaeon]|nr:serine protease [Nanoarchaeota archaeon]
SYSHEIQSSDRYVRYYETEPYKGMPAIVPFDTKEGWYAATQQTLPAFGGIGAFDASGRVTSFWICNVGENGRIQFDSGFGDDLCQQINLNTGQPLNAFPGLDSAKATSLIQRGQKAIQDAARQYGNKFVSIDGERFEVGAPATGTASTQCQDFMSPKDCNLLFNVCDPVVCPPSRCNLGGTYHVADVIQTGIIGSIFLCLPNIREGIFIPICLTGIHAGIEALISIMRNYRDCLQESLDTGQMVGICDEIYSIYLCEFFWNQVAPFVNIIIPKLIEMAYGQGVRGGAEYLSVMSAWQNMQNSIDYFTQSYAVNSFEAFQARNVQEVGTQFCKAFVSVKAPTAFDTLLEPDSPPQFYAWFDQKTFTTATVPATSQYKVFYHIFAGNDQGVHYNVYLKNPPTSGYYISNPVVSVASGYINKGEYASETKDFTAPEGYKELCVRINNDEECGFGQVSTDFAVNYLRDSYIKDEASRVTITSQKECISGSNNPAALLNPNVQAGVEEAISPEIYNRGIVRICSSENPGSSTDPSRYVDTGYCDDPKIRCWIDKKSVEQAITSANVGVLNETLEVLDQRTKELLEAQGQIYGDSEAAQKLLELKEAVKKLQTPQEALNLLNESDQLFRKLFWNKHKAELLIVEGDVYSWLTLNYKALDDAAKPEQKIEDETPSTTTGGGATVQEQFSAAQERNDIPETLVNVFGQENGQLTGGNGFFVPLKDTSLGILTAYHIVESEVSDGNVDYNKVSEGSSTEQALFKTSEEKEDLALLESARPIDSVKVVKFADKISVGEGVYIIGQNPNQLAKGVQSITASVQKADQANPGGGNNLAVLSAQSDFDKGLSGSPVFNTKYELVGVATSSSSGDQKIIFVVPISTIKKKFDSIDYGQVGGEGGGATVICEIKRFSVDAEGNILENDVKTGLVLSGNSVFFGGSTFMQAGADGKLQKILVIDWSSIEPKIEAYVDALMGWDVSALRGGGVTKDVCGGEQDSSEEIFTINLPGATPLYYKFNGEWLWSDNGNDWYKTDTLRTKSGRRPVQNNIAIITLLRGQNFENGKVILEKARNGIIGDKNLCELSYQGVWNPLSREECKEQGNCYFVDNTWPIQNECHSCVGVSCTSYPSQATCTEDMCGLSCAWKSGDGVCYGAQHSILQDYGVTPCKDAQGSKIAVKVDLPQNAGSYGVDSNGVLMYYLVQEDSSKNDWVNIRTAVGENNQKVWPLKSSESKAWLIQLEAELNAATNLQDCGGGSGGSGEGDWVKQSYMKSGGFFDTKHVTPYQESENVQFDYPGVNAKFRLTLGNGLEQNLNDGGWAAVGNLDPEFTEGYTYGVFKEELCLYKNYTTAGSCTWNSDKGDTPLPVGERFDFAADGNVYRLTTKMYRSDGWEPTKLFIIINTGVIRWANRAVGPYDIDHSISIGNTEGVFPSSRSEVPILNIVPGFVNEPLAGVSLCNFKKFVKRSDGSGYSVDLEFTGSGGGCPVP